MSRIVLISGANTGIGFEAVKAIYSTKGQATTILVCGRSIEKAQAAIASLEQEFPGCEHTLVAMQLDITDDESIEAAVTRVTSDYGHLDVLINNAGASFDNEIIAKRMTMRQAWNASWDVNVVGTQIMTHTFAPLLLKSSDARLLFITSGTSSLGETLSANWHSMNAPAPAGWPKSDAALRLISYRSTKTGLNMLMREWVKLLTEDGVKTWCISPGFLATGLTGTGAEALRKMGARDPSIGGNFIRDVVDGKRDADVGTIIRVDGVQPW